MYKIFIFRYNHFTLDLLKIFSDTKIGVHFKGLIIRLVKKIAFMIS